MQKNILEILFLILGSSAISVIINNLFLRKKTNVEIESIIVKNYKDIVSDLKSELERIKIQVDDLSRKEQLYIENSNLLLRDKVELSKRVSQLEKDNVYLHEENRKLKQHIQKLENNG